MTQGDTILFKIVGSNRVFTQEEVRNIIRKDPDALFLTYPVWANGEPRYKLLGSEELYTLEEIRNVIRRDPLVLLVVYQSNRGSSCREGGHTPPLCKVGNMDGQTASQKFG